MGQQDSHPAARGTVLTCLSSSLPHLSRVHWLRHGVRLRDLAMLPLRCNLLRVNAVSLCNYWLMQAKG